MSEQLLRADYCWIIACDCEAIEKHRSVSNILSQADEERKQPTHAEHYTQFAPKVLRKQTQTNLERDVRGLGTSER